MYSICWTLDPDLEADFNSILLLRACRYFCSGVSLCEDWSLISVCSNCPFKVPWKLKHDPLDRIQCRAARYAGATSAASLRWSATWAGNRLPHGDVTCAYKCMMCKIAHTVVGNPWAEWLTTTKRVTRGFHAWKCHENWNYIPIRSQHNIYYKFSFLPAQ